MKYLKNDTTENLSIDQHKAIIECEELLTKTFKRRVFAVFLNRDQRDASILSSVSFNFDQYEVRP